MRELTGHKVNGVNDGLQVVVCDEPGCGGASHHYQIIDVSRQNTAPDADRTLVSVQFQNGPIREHGVNGITHEALLAVLIDRLEGFQRGPFACGANAKALLSLRDAQESLLSRTRERAARGVEGTLQQ